MCFFENYEAKSAYPAIVQDSGDYLATIKTAKLELSSTGKRFLSIVCELESELNPIVILYLEEGENFCRDATLFYDTFGIERGNTNTELWKGNSGYIHVEPEGQKMLCSWIINSAGYACSIDDKNRSALLSWPEEPTRAASIHF